MGRRVPKIHGDICNASCDQAHWFLVKNGLQSLCHDAVESYSHPTWRKIDNFISTGSTLTGCSVKLLFWLTFILQGHKLLPDWFARVLLQLARRNWILVSQDKLAFGFDSCGWNHFLMDSIMMTRFSHAFSCACRTGFRSFWQGTCFLMDITSSVMCLGVAWIGMKNVWKVCAFW